jgi:transposase InsO family protein
LQLLLGELLQRPIEFTQYTSDRYQRLLGAHGVTFSMSRRGNCFDNAPTESFFRTLKVEIDEDGDWPTRRAATRAIADFIERFYNRERLHSSLNYQSPAAFERRRCAA